MPVVVVDWESAHRHGEVWIAQHRLRHRIFVERLGWNVSTYHGLEYDAFDTPAAKYIVWLDADGEARGIVRLVPTTVPYMIHDVWPDWLASPLPHCREVWEATRFGCDHQLAPAQRRRAVLEMIAGCERFGIANGISSYLAVMPMWIFERILISAGCGLTMLAPPRTFDGDLVGVARVEISLAVLARVEAKLPQELSSANDTGVPYRTVA
jgi:N-acyl-L-homoserine lactone synthetase